ncbi:hypothetical protein [Mangrovicoccus sp. HB161399]|uniref:hypothetical protein n=1 Tax=Mangrovicoccus sp. HB161399 TaxID=2720392 RepID=UPI001554B67F|nr:hypothetical protein [Mangrovicoccus sp. HB161399]
MHCRELFGDDAHEGLLQRAAALWSLMRGDPRVAHCGTVLSLSDPRGDTAEILPGLARLQGLGMCFFLPGSGLEPVMDELRGHGLRVASSPIHRGGAAAHAASRTLLAARTVPEGLGILRLDAGSPSAPVTATVELCRSCGLPTMPGEAMRGGILPGLCLVAIDRAGAPVATATSCAMHAPVSSRAGNAGGSPGAGLGRQLGAMAIAEMWQEQGMRSFRTGVKEGNLASQAACANLRIERAELVTAFCFQGARLKTGRAGA